MSTRRTYPSQNVQTVMVGDRAIPLATYLAEQKKTRSRELAWQDNTDAAEAVRNNDDENGGLDREELDSGDDTESDQGDLLGEIQEAEYHSFYKEATGALDDEEGSDDAVEPENLFSEEEYEGNSDYDSDGEPRLPEMPSSPISSYSGSVSSNSGSDLSSSPPPERVLKRKIIGGHVYTFGDTPPPEERIPEKWRNFQDVPSDFTSEISFDWNDPEDRHVAKKPRLELPSQWAIVDDIKKGVDPHDPKYPPITINLRFREDSEDSTDDEGDLNLEDAEVFSMDEEDFDIIDPDYTPVIKDEIDLDDFEPFNDTSMNGQVIDLDDSGFTPPIKQEPGLEDFEDTNMNEFPIYREQWHDDAGYTPPVNKGHNLEDFENVPFKDTSMNGEVIDLEASKETSLKKDDVGMSGWDDTKPKMFTLAEIVEDFKNRVHPYHPKYPKFQFKFPKEPRPGLSALSADDSDDSDWEETEMPNKEYLELIKEVDSLQKDKRLQGRKLSEIYAVANEEARLAQIEADKDRIDFWGYRIPSSEIDIWSDDEEIVIETELSCDEESSSEEEETSSEEEEEESDSEEIETPGVEAGVQVLEESVLAQELEALFEDDGAHAQIFGAPAQLFSTPAQPFGAPAQQFGLPVQPFGAPALPFGAAPQPFGAPGQSCGAPPQPFGAGAQSLDAQAQPFGAQAQPFGAPAQTFGAPAQPFGAPAQHFGAPAQPFGAQAQPVGAPTPAKTNTKPKAATKAKGDKNATGEKKAKGDKKAKPVKKAPGDKKGKSKPKEELTEEQIAEKIAKQEEANRIRREKYRVTMSDPVHAAKVSEKRKAEREKQDPEKRSADRKQWRVNKKAKDAAAAASATPPC